MKTVEQDERELTALATQIVESAVAAGASVAESVARRGSHLTSRVRCGETELIEEAASNSLGLKVIVNQQVASTYTNDFSAAGIERLVSDALELAHLSQPDPYALPPDPADLSKPEDHVDLDLFDADMGAMDADQALKMARDAEDASFAYDPRIRNSKGSSVSRAAASVAVVTSGGFVGCNSGTYASLAVRPIAEEGEGDALRKRTGHHWAARRHMRELESAHWVGEEAARRTLRKLGAQKIGTQEVAVIFDPDAARAMLGFFASCVVGGPVWRKQSYLVDRLETNVASSTVTIIDDPLIPKAPGSRAFDGEGLLSRRNVVVENGVLKNYLLDSYSARKLDMKSTASASRGLTGGVSASTTNLILKPGTISHDELVASTPRGLYVTEMMGFGFNAVTGDFSRGASGFWVENGELTHAVSEVTISLNLDKLFQSIDAIADDLDLRSSIASPSFRVASMTVAGKS